MGAFASARMCRARGFSPPNAECRKITNDLTKPLGELKKEKKKRKKKRCRVFSTVCSSRCARRRRRCCCLAFPCQHIKHPGSPFALCSLPNSFTGVESPASTAASLRLFRRRGNFLRNHLFIELFIVLGTCATLIGFFQCGLYIINK